MNDNLPLRYVLDLALDQRAPDPSSLIVFKQRLVAEGSWGTIARIHDAPLQQGRDRGLPLGQIQLADSVYTQADVNPEKNRACQKQGQTCNTHFSDTPCGMGFSLARALEL